MMRVKHLLLLVVAVPTLAVDTETAGLMNGRAWVDMNDGLKTLYVRGMYDCALAPFLSPWSIPAKTPGAGDIITSIEMVGTTFGEMAKAVDVFYSDSLNLRVPVVYAMMWVKNKHDGDPPKLLEEYAAALRSRFNIEHQPVKPQ